jgi:hypothetical protein
MWSRDLLVGLATAAAVRCVAPRNHPAPDVPANASLLPAEPTAPPATYRTALVLSGGGARGAFAAGVLSGWSESGTRPKFDVVTAVSAGAVIAPFAFLGSSYDDLLKLYLLCRYVGAGYHIAAISEGLPTDGNALKFDTGTMRRLYRGGREVGLSGQWTEFPPGISPDEQPIPRGGLRLKTVVRPPGGGCEATQGTTAQTVRHDRLARVLDRLAEGE